MPPLLADASFDAATKARIAATATQLVGALRRKSTGSGVAALVHEYSLSSEEGVALMCLAEALLRIPDAPTRDALIRDKIAKGDWASHAGHGRSLFVNAATWGLVLTGQFTATVSEAGLAGALTRLIARVGEPVIRGGVDLAMRMMGEQFVLGETIGEALKNAQKHEARGFCYSYDMLGEAALTQADADRYFADYETAIDAIGRASGGRGIHAGPGISIKLSALHPRYSRAQRGRVMAELLPRLRALALQAKAFDIGLNIDAEEADRLELSLDLLEKLSFDDALAGWDGLGFVVQAYGRRCPFVLDFIIDLARRARRRIMLRLVKGAYWDSEIKRAQVEGLASYPVFTRKAYTDLSYIACARKLLAAGDAVFPQFATHNAQTLATIYHLAGSAFRPGQYEFQCLHGMGEPLYEEVVGPARLDRPCRVYAPVGTHETLLAYLVRRLLENGANSSFVNRINDPAIAIEELVRDPADEVRAMPVVGAPHPAIPDPAGLYGVQRRNSAGLDLSSETVLADLTERFRTDAEILWRAAPAMAVTPTSAAPRPVVDPGDNRDVVGEVIEAQEADACEAVRAAAASSWSEVPVTRRAACLRLAADAVQQRMPVLIGLIMREAGKTAANAIGEVREAIDFLRYYASAAEAMPAGAKAIGPVVCISPWNFPLAIFAGQIAAALAAGNPVLAKPAEETPLIAAECVGILHASGIPRDALQLLPGDGAIGAALVAASEVAGVLFTGSTEVARLIRKQLAARTMADGKPPVLVAETGGLNAMIVDSSALAEQVVADVVASAFDSAGQRCSALRLLCLQEEIAERVFAMLKGAMKELRVAPTLRLATDVGPVISAQAQRIISQHVEHMRASGHAVTQIDVDEDGRFGTFVPPTLIELNDVSELTREVFGPVLHVVRYARENLDRLIDAINASGYGLTFGLHTRIDETIAHVASRIAAGNLYVNRNIIGAVVGVQPFGGRGLSGTGPKAGGPLYLRRLVHAPPSSGNDALPSMPAAESFARWLDQRGDADSAASARAAMRRSQFGRRKELPGPVGETNRHELHARGRLLLVPLTAAGLYRQVGAALATGNTVTVDAASGLRSALDGLPPDVADRVRWTTRWAEDGPFAAALVEGDAARVRDVGERVAALPGPLVTLHAATSDELAAAEEPYDLVWLLEEVTISINTAAAGGNASLLALA